MEVPILEAATIVVTREALWTWILDRAETAFVAGHDQFDTGRIFDTSEGALDLRGSDSGEGAWALAWQLRSTKTDTAFQRHC